MRRRGLLLLAWLVLAAVSPTGAASAAGGASAAGAASAADTHPSGFAHRHRIVGLAAKAAMMHSSVLYHESASDRILDRDLARQHAREIARLVRAQIAHLRALKGDSKENQPAAQEVQDMSALAGRAGAEADTLLEALSSGGRWQARARTHAQRLFHIERRILQLHQSAEAILGIVPPPDPPEPEPPAR